jgi:hypothetical protein
MDVAAFEGKSLWSWGVEEEKEEAEEAAEAAA